MFKLLHENHDEIFIFWGEKTKGFFSPENKKRQVRNKIPGI